MYVEASGKSRGKNAKIVSPKYQGAEDQCMEFYYHMYGVNIGTLNVYFMVSDFHFSDDDCFALWKRFLATVSLQE